MVSGASPRRPRSAFTREVEAAQARVPAPHSTWPRAHPQSAAAGPGAQAAEGRAALAPVLLMTRKRKVVYPPSRSSKGTPPPRAPQVTPATVATINTQAGVGRAGIVPGMRVVIQGTGLYAGETAVVQSLVPGVIAAAVVKTDARADAPRADRRPLAGPQGRRRAGREPRRPRAAPAAATPAEA